ncbi:MAG: SAM-dependent methyltransferase [Prevotellaceae bacterium]|nr:SAM-dependent methyltransferase [Prevotellaceae bacterium]
MQSDFKDDLKLAPFFVTKKFEEKLKITAYHYQNSINTSFYFIAAILSTERIQELRKYIWNKNNADIILIQTKKNEWRFLYGKCNPNKISLKECEIDKFSISELEEEKFERIKRSKFDSGAFWLRYADFIDRAKNYKKIDKDLVETLETLKNQINDKWKTVILDEKERSKNVQALIDRTLYIKYLEDNHIINSDFYYHYFKDEKLNYEKILRSYSCENINLLFEKIHTIFNNQLFEKPKIDDNYLTLDICDLIATSFRADLKEKQLRLFDFQFEVLPIDFISYIYEVFLTKEQKSNGIYYTPKRLAQLIIDNVINEDTIGSILDPSCGSGMFLIVGFQRLLEIAQKEGKEPQDNISKIKFRTELLSKNIFGIEKQPTAQRLTLFSLSLQIFNGIPPDEIRKYIANKLNNDEEFNLFSEFDFYKNIICQNTLDVENKPFNDKKFKYIVGNPPFFEISSEDAELTVECDFLNHYEIALSDNNTELQFCRRNLSQKTNNLNVDKFNKDKELNLFSEFNSCQNKLEDESQLLNFTIKAKDIVGNSQISQCFFLKIKEWSNSNTRFGFVSNSSNFYNDNSDMFQKYFYTNYNIEKIYELSRVKKILFENAGESVVSLIFTNDIQQDNQIKYYPVDSGLLSQKPFELLVIQEDSVIIFLQSKLANNKIRLRDYLVASEYDLDIINSITKKYDKLENFLTSCMVGIGIIRKDVIKKYNEQSITILQDKDDYKKMKSNFIQHFFSAINSDEFSIPYVEYNDIVSPYVCYPKQYLREQDIINEKFRRNKNITFFQGEKILCRRIMNISDEKAQIFSLINNQTLVGTDQVYFLRLNNQSLYYLINAILNSLVVCYIINVKFVDRFGQSWTRLNKNFLYAIPIPKELDEDLVAEISEISKELTEGKYEYSEKKIELNELIFDLYDLSYTERQRIKDYFLPKREINRCKTDPIIDNYKKTLTKLLNFYLKNPITENDIEFSNDNFNLLVATVPLKGADPNNPTANKVQKFTIDEVIAQNPNAKILTGQEKVFTKDCVYIIKSNNSQNWTATKAFEDREEILKRLNSN